MASPQAKESPGFTGVRQVAYVDDMTGQVIHIQYMVRDGKCVGIRKKGFNSVTEYRTWGKSINS